MFLSMQITIPVTAMKLSLTGQFWHLLVYFSVNKNSMQSFGVSYMTFKGTPQNRGWCKQDTV